MTQILGSRRDFSSCDDEKVTEFVEIVASIVAIPEYQELKNFYQHHATTRYQHCLNVAYYTYRWSKLTHLDYISATRGAMLHDFFTYDYKVPGAQPIKGRHSEVHPMVALANAEKYLPVNAVMRDCILHHMWPMTAIRPQTKEGFVVQFADKYCASLEASSRPYYAIKPAVLKAFSLLHL